MPDKIDKTIHLTVTLRNGMKILEVCKDQPVPDDLVSATIEAVTCYECLATYWHYLNLKEEVENVPEDKIPYSQKH